MSKRHKRQHNQETKAAVSVFWQIIRRFASRYWIRLTFGIITSLIMGGAVSVILRVMDFGLNVFENLNDPEEAAPKGAIVVKQKKREQSLPAMPVQPNLGKHADIPARHAISQPDKTVPAPKKTAAKKSTDKYFDQAEKIARQLGFELEIDREGAMSLELLIIIIGLMFTFFLIKSGGEFLTKYQLKWVGAKVVTDIRVELFKTLQRQSVSFYDKNDVGKLIARCTNDTAAVSHSISASIGELFTAPLMILASFQFIISKAMDMNLFTQSIWLLFSLPCCIVPVYLLSRYVRKYQKRVLSDVAILVTRMQENFSGIRLVKAYNSEEQEISKFNRDSTKYFKAVRKSLLAEVCMQPLMQLVMLGVGAIFLVICYKYGLTLASLAVLAFAAQEAYRPLKELAKINNDLQRTAAACERILALLESNTALQPLEPVQHPESFRHDIVFKDVSFKYAPDGEDIIRDLNITIPRGSLVAIVGPTGSGKTTIANLLARFYDPTRGTIAIDGVDLRSIANENLRKLVGIVSQETFLFNDSIANNIKFGTPGADDEQVRKAAVQANAEAFILDKPEQYQQSVGERGNLLSGGQKQRISIARALLKNPPILILDEATSALDTQTEKFVQEAFENLMQDRTVLAIAHRLSTVMNADQILVCKDGQIIERGTHQELLALNGTYSKLFKLQFGENTGHDA